MGLVTDEVSRAAHTVAVITDRWLEATEPELRAALGAKGREAATTYRNLLLALEYWPWLAEDGISDVAVASGSVPITGEAGVMGRTALRRAGLEVVRDEADAGWRVDRIPGTR